MGGCVWHSSGSTAVNWARSDYHFLSCLTLRHLKNAPTRSLRRSPPPLKPPRGRRVAREVPMASWKAYELMLPSLVATGWPSSCVTGTCNQPQTLRRCWRAAPTLGKNSREILPLESGIVLKVVFLFLTHIFKRMDKYKELCEGLQLPIARVNSVIFAPRRWLCPCCG